MNTEHKHNGLEAPLLANEHKNAGSSSIVSAASHQAEQLLHAAEFDFAKVMSSINQAIRFLAEGSNVIFTGFASEVIFLIAVDVMRIETDEKAVDTTDQLLLLAAWLPFLYGFYDQMLRQWFADQIGSTWNSINKGFRLLSKIVTTHFFAVDMLNGAFVAAETNGQGSSHGRFMMTPTGYLERNLGIVFTMDALQLITELKHNPDTKWKAVKFFLEWINRTAEIVQLYQTGLLEAKQPNDYSDKGLALLYSASAIAGFAINALSSYYRLSEGTLQPFEHFVLFLEANIPATCFALFQFHQTARHWSTTEQNIQNVLFGLLACIPFGVRYFNGPAHVEVHHHAHEVAHLEVIEEHPQAERVASVSSQDHIALHIEEEKNDSLPEKDDVALIVAEDMDKKPDVVLPVPVQVGEHKGEVTLASSAVAADSNKKHPALCEESKMPNVSNSLSVDASEKKSEPAAENKVEVVTRKRVNSFTLFATQAANDKNEAKGNLIARRHSH